MINTSLRLSNPPQPMVTCHTAMHMIKNVFDGSWCEGQYDNTQNHLYIALIDDSNGQEVYWNSGHACHETLHYVLYQVDPFSKNWENLTHYNYNLLDSPYNDWVVFKMRYDIIHSVNVKIPIPNVGRLLNDRLKINAEIAEGTAPKGSNKYV